MQQTFSGMETANKPQIKGDCHISKCGNHRYWLSRVWDSEKPMIAFIGLNPSRADTTFNDPTIKKLIKFSQSWNVYGEQKGELTQTKKYGGMIMLNLYSFRTPDPDILRKQVDIGTAKNYETDVHLQFVIGKCATIVVCWGSWKFIHQRSKEVLAMVKNPYCFGVNKDQQPKHPLYLKDTTTLVPYNP